MRLGPQVVRVVNARGYNVAVWRENEIVYSLVSDLDETALFELVRTAQAGPLSTRRARRARDTGSAAVLTARAGGG